MKLADLQHDQQVQVRCGRAGRESPQWGEWHAAKLHIQRDARFAGRSPKAGGVAVLALKTLDDKPVDWAEYDGDDFDPKHKVFLVEDYYLEIEGLEA